MRSCLSLTLVLLATLSGQAAGATELSRVQAPLTRLLLSVAPADALSVADCDATFNVGPAVGAGLSPARGAHPVQTLQAPVIAAPPHRDYAAQLATAQPCHGP